MRRQNVKCIKIFVYAFILASLCLLIKFIGEKSLISQPLYISWKHENLLDPLQMIFDETADYKLPQNKSLKHFILKTGGTPMRSFVVSALRSGSSFFGDLLNAVPGSFYHFEPLIPFDRLFKSPPDDQIAIDYITKLMNCDYSHVNRSLLEQNATYWYFKFNQRLWNYCRMEFPSEMSCRDPKFLEPFCKLFPFQSMKIVRLGLRSASHFLEDQSLNVRMVFLVRDPRGVMNSRMRQTWCTTRLECTNINVLCKDMEENFKTAVELLKKYPKTFSVVRYEQLALDPYGVSKEILKFYGLTYDAHIETFLNEHTKIYKMQQWTSRNSKANAFKWIKDSSYKNVAQIQKICSTAMELWGYKTINHESQLTGNFYPLLPLNITSIS